MNSKQELNADNGGLVDQIKILTDEHARLKDENAKLKRKLNCLDLIDTYYGRSLAIIVGAMVVWFVCWPVVSILSIDVKTNVLETLAWSYGLKVMGSIAVLCVLLWVFLALVRSDRRD